MSMTRNPRTLPKGDRGVPTIGDSTPGSGTWYQEATINGIEMPARRRRDTSARRWQAFLETLIEEKKGEGRVFIELGCNAGFYLRKAADLGYKTIGVENNPIFLAHARYWEACDPKGVKIIEGDLNKFNLPCAHTVLLANVHYWLTPEQLAKLVKKLRAKAINVIVVGRHKAIDAHKSACDYTSLRETFADWKAKILVIGKKEKHYSVLFQNPDLYEKNAADISFYLPEYKNRHLIPAYRELIELVRSGKEFIPEETAYFNYLRMREKDSSWLDKDVVFERRRRLIGDMAERGQMKPLKMYGDVLWDGDHRLLVARALGIRYMVCEAIKGEPKKIAREVDVEELFHKQPFAGSRQFLPTFEEFIDIVLSGEPFDPLKTRYYRYLQVRANRRFLQKHIDLIRSVKENGIVKPLRVKGGILRGGNHRLIIAHRIGIKRVLCEIEECSAPTDVGSHQL